MLSRVALQHVSRRIVLPARSTSLVSRRALSYALNEDGDASRKEEVIRFPAVDSSDPSYNQITTPILLNAKEHVVGYLSRILNARVYDAAIETELQHARNLSAVRTWCMHNASL